MKLEKVVMTIAVCFIVLLTTVNVAMVFQIHQQNKTIAQGEAQAIQQQRVTQSFVNQVRGCKTMRELDMVLKANGLERIR